MKKTNLNKTTFELSSDEVKEAIIDYIKKKENLDVEPNYINFYTEDGDITEQLDCNVVVINPKIEEKEYKPSHS
jgi:hypothetical protein